MDEWFEDLLNFPSGKRPATFSETEGSCPKSAKFLGWARVFFPQSQMVSEKKISCMNPSPINYVDESTK